MFSLIPKHQTFIFSACEYELSSFFSTMNVNGCLSRFTILEHKGTLWTCDMKLVLTLKQWGSKQSHSFLQNKLHTFEGIDLFGTQLCTKVSYENLLFMWLDLLSILFTLTVSVNPHKSGPKVIKRSTQLRLKFKLLINDKIVQIN